MTTSKQTRSARPWWSLPVAALVLVIIGPILVPVVAVVFLLHGLKSVILHLAIWTFWCSRGRDVLFVYSESPHWHEYLTRRVLPVLGERAVLLNWSERRRWRPSLARAAFRHFGGHAEFNPMAVLFRPFGRTRTYRFWQAFRDQKHGNPEPLRRLEREFFDAAGVTEREADPHAEDSSNL